MVLAGLAFFLALAVSLDFPRTALGFKGDEATYYSLTYSLARDGDMAFKREDLVRVWEEFSAPEGIFLKRGSQLHVERRSGFPFFGVVGTPDPAPDRLYFGKSYIYPLFAAPFVRIFGTSGFLVFHSLLLALCTAAGYSFLVARGSRPTAAAAFAAVFIFGSIAPVYFFWLTPEFFNLTLVFLAVFVWAYKFAEAPPVRSGRLQRFLTSPASDLLAAVLLGLATFSKPTHILAALPLFLWPLFQRRWWRVVCSAPVSPLTVVALFLVNVAATGEANYQGGDRKTFYSSSGFPVRQPLGDVRQQRAAVATGACRRRSCSSATPRSFSRGTSCTSSLAVQRPRPVLLPRRARRPAVSCPACGAAAVAVVRRAGSGGRRRRLACLHAIHLLGRRRPGRQPLLPQLLSAVSLPRAAAAQRGPALVALVIGALFIAKVTLNPFYSSFHPGEHAKAAHCGCSRSSGRC